MKKLFVVVFMFAATVSFAVAQPGGQGGQRQRMTAEERAKSTTERMTTLLALNAEQKAKIEAIELELSKQMETERQNAQGNGEAMTAAFQKIDKVRDEKYKTVLTADQFKKYTDDKAQRPQRGQRGQGGQGGGQGQGRRSN